LSEPGETGAPSGAAAPEGSEGAPDASVRGFGTRLISQSAVYGLGNVLSKTIAVFLVPIYTRVLTPADYGLVSISNVLYTFLLLFLNLGTSSALFRYYHEAADDGERKDYVTGAFWLLMGSAILIVAFAFLAAGPVAQLLFGHADKAGFVRMTALWCFMSAFPLVPLAIFRAEGKPKLFISVTVGSFLVNVVMTIIFIVVLRRGAIGVIESSVVATAMVAVAILAYLVRRIRFRPRLSHVRAILSFGLPLVPFGLGMLVINMGGRVMLNRIAGATETGLYSLGYTAGMLVNLVLVQPFQTAWWPMVFASHKEEGAAERFGRVLTYLLFIGFAMALYLGVLAREAIEIIAARPFWGSWDVTFWVALAYVMYGAFYCVSVGSLLAGRSKHFTPLALIGAGAALAGYFVLIPRFGRLGAAWATLLGFTVMSVAAFFMAQPRYRVPYEWSRIARLVLVAGATYAITVGIVIQPAWLGLIAKALLIGAFYLGGLWVLRFFRKSEIRKARELWLSAFSRARLGPAEEQAVEELEEALETSERP
jgi:O-antigen/teichoic acid export membrane protein